MKRKLNRILISVISLFICVTGTLALFNSHIEINNKFKAINYKIIINTNGGKYNINSITVKNGKTTLPTPTRIGYTFKNYTINSSNINTSNINISDINNKNIVANWNVVNYSISYNLNGGTITNQPTSYNIEKSITLPTPSKSGYEFTGWTGSNGSTPQKNVTISKGNTGNKSYTANWKAITYYTVDINPIIQNQSYMSGLDSFKFSVYINGTLVSDHVTDYYSTTISSGTKFRVVVHARDGYNITSFTDKTWTISSNLNIEPSWYDNIAPTITNFYNSWETDVKHTAARQRHWYVYASGYDNGCGIGSSSFKMNNWSPDGDPNGRGDPYNYATTIWTGKFTCVRPQALTFSYTLCDSCGNCSSTQFSQGAW